MAQENNNQPQDILPKYMRPLILHLGLSEQEVRGALPGLWKPLGMVNYKDKSETLLYLEEAKERKLGTGSASDDRFRIAHRAVNEMERNPFLKRISLFWPKGEPFMDPLVDLKYSPISWKNVSLNGYQKLAVSHILGLPGRPTPYLINGLFGTERTETLLEVILQVFEKNLSSNSILISCASNSSAHELAYKLTRMGVSKDDLVVVEDAGKIPQYNVKIVVSTFECVGAIFKEGEVMFSYTFINDAHKLTEPDTLPPMLLSALNGGYTILDGDRRGPGPVVKSRPASDNGLNISLFTRLFNNFEEDGRINDPRLCIELNEA